MAFQFEPDLNQPPYRGDIDLWNDDPALVSYAAKARAHLAGYARELGKAETRVKAREANRVLPELRLFDRGGRRLDEVFFHPAYHDLMTLGVEAGYIALPWSGQKATGQDGHLAHAAMVYLHSQVEPGTCCPMTMSYAAVPALEQNPALSKIWRPKLTSKQYDPTYVPIGKKTGATLGMAMTEKQGGSDIRSNQTRTERDGDGYRLYGHKWFCSAPMSDGFLTLAQTDAGLTCFLVPRWGPDGRRNAIHLMRLKDKLGNRANASAEIEYHGAWGDRIGEEGDGIRTIIEMVHHTRLDTAMAPAGLMRGSLCEAHYWASHRTAFQKRLIDQPLMRRVLADLALDWEGALALGLHVAEAFDACSRDFARVGVALAKFLSNKLCVSVTYEAMEVLGGMGYVEDTTAPMFYREAPLNSIWEGSGNVICLDILRSLAKEEVKAELEAELAVPRGSAKDYDRALFAFQERWSKGIEETDAREFATEAARLLTASVLIRKASEAVAEAYIATRITDRSSRVAGTGEVPHEAAILARLGPV